MVDALRIGLITQAASGLVVTVFGLLLLWAKPRRRSTVAFGAFLAVWGAFILAGNWASLVVTGGDLTGGYPWMLLHAVLVMLAYVPLVYFALVYPPSQTRGPDRAWIAGAIMAPAVGGVIALYLQPSLFLEGFVDAAGTTATDWGPLHLIYTTLFALATYLVLARLAQVHRSSEHGLERRRARLLMLALGLYVAFESAQNLVLYRDAILSAGSAGWDPAMLTFAATAALGLLVLGAVGVSLLQAPSSPGLSPGAFIGLITLPLAMGAVSAVSYDNALLPMIVSDGLWRLAAVALLVYAILRFELFGLEASMARWVGGLGLLAGAVVGLVSVHVLLEQVTGSRVLSLVLLQGSLVGALGLVAVTRPEDTRRWLTTLTDRSDPGEGLRALEVYEAALIGSLSLPQEKREAELANLRERLGITENEHTLLMRAIRSEPPGETEPPPIEKGDLVADRYQVERTLGEGAQSRVLLAQDTKLDRPVALKVLAPLAGSPERAVRRFLHELRVSSRIQHPNVIEVYDFGYERGRPYLVLEHVGGGSLAERIEERGHLDERETVRILAGVLAGLADIHDRGLIHRDLKPTNILLTSDGRAKIADLGLAALWRVDETQAIPEDEMGIEGTPAYMAPEALRGSRLGPAADVYSAGAILYEALTGRHYLHLEGESYEVAYRRVLEQPPRPPGIDTDEELKRIWRRALAKRPSARFRSARSMREALLDVVDSGDPVPERVTGRGGRS